MLGVPKKAQSTILTPYRVLVFGLCNLVAWGLYASLLCLFHCDQFSEEDYIVSGFIISLECKGLFKKRHSSGDAWLLQRGD